jgi:hypothetical protein
MLALSKQLFGEYKTFVVKPMMILSILIMLKLNFYVMLK